MPTVNMYLYSFSERSTDREMQTRAHTQINTFTQNTDTSRVRRQTYKLTRYMHAHYTNIQTVLPSIPPSLYLPCSHLLNTKHPPSSSLCI